MKVLVINTVPFCLNGITSVIMNYHRNMEKVQTHFDFVACDQITPEYQQMLEQSGSRVFLLPRKKNTLKYMWQLFRLAKKHCYDVVHIHGNSALMLLDVLPVMLAQVPVRIVHSHNTTCTHKRAHKLFQPIFKCCYTHGFACGESAGRWLFEGRPFEIIENGIELTHYAYDPEVREQMRQELQVGDRTVIGHVGNFNEQKNHMFLLEAFAVLLQKKPEYLLLLIGDGPLWETARQKAEALGIAENVVFLGKTMQVSSYLQAMDVFLLPSLYEGLPVVLIEAQAAGLPCIVSDQISKETDVCGKLNFQPIRDINVWADAIQTLRYANREECSRLWREALTSRGYDITQNARRMKDLYASYLADRKRR